MGYGDLDSTNPGPPPIRFTHPPMRRSLSPAEMWVATRRERELTQEDEEYYELVARVEHHTKVRAERYGIDQREVRGTGPSGMVMPDDVLREAEKRDPELSKSTEIARDLAEKHGLDLNQIEATGEDGRVTGRDVHHAFYEAEGKRRRS